jgi:hypothetical protein
MSSVGAIHLKGKSLQIPANEYRCYYVKARARIHRRVDGRMAIFHGPREAYPSTTRKEISWNTNRSKAKGRSMNGLQAGQLMCFKIG